MTWIGVEWKKNILLGNNPLRAETFIRHLTSLPVNTFLHSSILWSRGPCSFENSQKSKSPPHVTSNRLSSEISPSNVNRYVYIGRDREIAMSDIDIYNANRADYCDLVAEASRLPRPICIWNSVNVLFFFYGFIYSNNTWKTTIVCHFHKLCVIS